MKAISLLYHDVVPAGDFAASGFAGGDAEIYKLELADFKRHLAEIDAAAPNRSSVHLTFDDGGASAHDHVAGLLEDLGWRGHFFITTNWIGKAGFVTADQIRDLRARGHVIGSHSCSHPPRMSYCSADQLRREWTNSIAVLSEIVGGHVDVASVPGGYYARNVAEAAAEAGIRTLFTSEPETRVQNIDGCAVLGRYTIQQGVSAATAAAIAAGRVIPRFHQSAYWNAKKVAKTLGGSSWLRMRKWILAR